MYYVPLNGVGFVQLCELWLNMEIFLSFFSASLSVSRTFTSWSKLKSKTRIIFYFLHNPLNVLLHSSHREELGHKCLSCVWLCGGQRCSCENCVGMGHWAVNCQRRGLWEDLCHRAGKGRRQRPPKTWQIRTASIATVKSPDVFI